MLLSSKRSQDLQSIKNSPLFGNSEIWFIHALRRYQNVTWRYKHYILLDELQILISGQSIGLQKSRKKTFCFKAKMNFIQLVDKLYHKALEKFLASHQEISKWSYISIAVLLVVIEQGILILLYLNSFVIYLVYPSLLWLTYF